MGQGYEVEAVLEGDRVIRLKEPIPCAEGPVQVILTRESGTAEPQDPNRRALQRLDRFLAEADDLTSQEWSEPEKVIEDHPLRIRNDACRPGKVDEIGNVPERVCPVPRHRSGGQGPL